MDNKADFNARNEGTLRWYNALHLASAFGNLCVVKLFLDLGMNLESTTTSSEHPRITPLTCAIRGFYKHNIDYILSFPLGFLPELSSFLGSRGAWKLVVGFLLFHKANLDGGSDCSRPRNYFRMPRGENLDISGCYFDNPLPEVARW